MPSGEGLHFHLFWLLLLFLTFRTELRDGANSRNNSFNSTILQCPGFCPCPISTSNSQLNITLFRLKGLNVFQLKLDEHNKSVFTSSDTKTQRLPLNANGVSGVKFGVRGSEVVHAAAVERWKGGWRGKSSDLNISHKKLSNKHSKSATGKNDRLWTGASGSGAAGLADNQPASKAQPLAQ